jgi:hypothetical protein
LDLRACNEGRDESDQWLEQRGKQYLIPLLGQTVRFKLGFPKQVFKLLQITYQRRRNRGTGTASPCNAGM